MENQLVTAPVVISKTPTISYLGFQATPEGREYRLRVTDGTEPRLFVMLISHQMFADHEARYQDGPDLCFSKLTRDLAVDPRLEPLARVELTARELRDYGTARKPVPPVKRRAAQR